MEEMLRAPPGGGYAIPDIPKELTQAISCSETPRISKIAPNLVARYEQAVNRIVPIHTAALF